MKIHQKHQKNVKLQNQQNMFVNIKIWEATYNTFDHFCKSKINIPFDTIATFCLCYCFYHVIIAFYHLCHPIHSTNYVSFICLCSIKLLPLSYKTIMSDVTSNLIIFIFVKFSEMWMELSRDLFSILFAHFLLSL